MCLLLLESEEFETAKIGKIYYIRCEFPEILFPFEDIFVLLFASEHF